MGPTVWLVHSFVDVGEYNAQLVADVSTLTGTITERADNLIDSVSPISCT